MRFKDLLNKKNKTEVEAVEVINAYEKNNQWIYDTDTLVKFIQWYDEQKELEE